MEAGAVCSIECHISSIAEPLRSMIKQVQKQIADRYADGDVGRVSIHIEGVPGGEVKVYVDDELIAVDMKEI